MAKHGSPDKNIQKGSFWLEGYCPVRVAPFPGFCYNVTKSPIESNLSRKAIFRIQAALSMTEVPWSTKIVNVKI